ncbi:uncharacterized protein CIMG_12953 [Coccidioides immitis RS]|uniref:Uncharacterized protein n=1 Tax=Coccidioides immitis (strain RS) TaxID=246410 RepID=J3K317_COCIM|nr:uncharacterized protein CIMG_12953 [Coccidioides immitis RS]EAS28532.3 hypothetical protein CIMG_12953 [Coccidioides immitis RS]
MGLNTDSHKCICHFLDNKKENQTNRSASSILQNNIMQEAINLTKNSDINILFEKNSDIRVRSTATPENTVNISSSAQPPASKHVIWHDAKQYYLIRSLNAVNKAVLFIAEQLWRYNDRHNVSNISSTSSNKSNKTEARRLHNIASFAQKHFMKKTYNIMMGKLSGLTAEE